MKFVLDNWVLILAALTSGFLLLWPILAKNAHGAMVNAAQAVNLINATVKYAF